MRELIPGKWVLVGLLMIVSGVAATAALSQEAVEVEAHTATESIALTFQAGGTVAEVLVRPGDWVQLGQVLIQLDSSTQRARVASAEAAVARAVAVLDGSQHGPAALAEAALELVITESNLIQAKGALADMEVRALAAGTVVSLEPGMVAGAKVNPGADALNVEETGGV